MSPARSITTARVPVELVTIDEVAVALGVKVRTAYHYLERYRSAIAAGDHAEAAKYPPNRIIGGRVIVTRQAFDAWLP